jgi:hypothetical protein
MGLKLATIAKVMAKQYPEQYRATVKTCEPMLIQNGLIPSIHSKIKEMHPELDRTDESILFAAVVYSAYAPATFEGEGIERCPNGVRSLMCQVMNWNDAPTVNYYHRISGAYLKGKAYQEKVSAILLGFQQFSVKSKQIELF